MHKLTKSILITPFTISLFIVVPTTQAEAISGPKVPAKLIHLSNFYENKFGGPSTKYKGSIPKRSMTKMLMLGWKSFGYSQEVAQRKAKKNYKQVMLESGARPYAVQALCDVNGCPKNNPNVAGGLFQFIPAIFKQWRVGDYSNRFRPVSNILATINAQINADALYTDGLVDGKGPRKIKILAGQGGWGPSGGTNPYKNPVLK